MHDMTVQLTLLPRAGEGSGSGELLLSGRLAGLQALKGFGTDADDVRRWLYVSAPAEPAAGNCDATPCTRSISWLWLTTASVLALSDCHRLATTAELMDA